MRATLLCYDKEICDYQDFEFLYVLGGPRGTLKWEEQKSET